MKQSLRLLTIAVFACIATVTMADEYKYLTFTSTKGAESSIAIDGLKMTFSNGTLAATQGGNTTSFIVANLEKMAFSTTKATNKADVNEDGSVDSADIMAIIKEMPDGDKKADVNGDGSIDSADILSVIKAM